jgi:dTDP-4-amino-4,6-dideoxygalactose transaminase
VNGGRRDELKAHLAEQGIGTEIYYPIPMHRQKCFSDFRISRDGLSQTEAASAEILNLPIYPELRIDEQLRVVETIKRYYGKSARAAA